MDDDEVRCVVITAAETGPGTAEENLNEIFEPFYSSKPTTGANLGLGVVRRLVQRYGGTMEVRSEIDNRTVFSVGLPYEK